MPRQVASLCMAVVLALAMGEPAAAARPNAGYSYNYGMGYRSSRCEPIEVPMCKSMPWNGTSMPNLVHQSTQRNARLYMEQYEPLVWTNCSQNLAFFLCAMYVPMCLSGGPDHDPIPPCRDVCAESRRSCEPIVLHYNRTWPDFLACDDLPEYEKGVCMAPRGFTSAMPPTTLKPVCKCKTELKFNRQDYHRGNYSYAMLATVLRQNLHESTGETATVVTPHRIFKDQQQLLGVGRQAHLWTPEFVAEPCNCVKLPVRKRYFVACRGDPGNGRLLLDTSCVVAPWLERWPVEVNEQTALELLSRGKIKLPTDGRNGPRTVTTAARTVTTAARTVTTAARTVTTAARTVTTTARTPTIHPIRHDRHGTRKPKEHRPMKNASN